MGTRGYWIVDADEAVCVDHKEGLSDDDLYPADSESDTPTHCAVCETLIDHGLTSDGYAYVADAILRHVESKGKDGRACIVRAWYMEYGDGLDPQDKDAILAAVVEGWPAEDEYSPKV